LTLKCFGQANLLPAMSKLIRGTGLPANVPGAGAPEHLIDDCPIEELVTATVAELCKVPLTDVEFAKLAGCLRPGLEHECPTDVFDCAFVLWQAQHLAVGRRQDTDDQCMECWI
jgi:hypothetical protein